jgi:hypothetical protein|tara:strand:+ start:1278 stop:2522 length:1245 start_codon:yes stop_codon:yes gene_type:complete
MSIPDTDLSYFCIWPKTEMNHDFGDSELFTVKVLNNKSTSLPKILKTHVGNVCSDRGEDLNLVNDEEIVKKVFNKSKDYFRDLQEGWFDININYKGHRNDNKVDILTKTIKLFKIKKNESSQITGLFKDDSKNIFKHIKTSDASKNHVFFIQDVAGDVVKQLKYVYDGDKKYHIHIINSVETIGDSASKIKPDCKKKYLYKKDPGNSKTRLFSWLYTKNRELSGTKDDLMFSSYQINTRYAQSTGQFKIDQVWSINGSSYYYPDINKENNRTTIRNEIKQVLGKDSSGKDRSFYNKDITDKEKQQISRALQRKRSGDYLQIKFAKDFPTIGESDFRLILPDVQQYTILNKQDWEYPNANSDSLIKLSTDIKKNNTFIITNDWPCLSYAIFNEVNVIFHNNSPTCKYLLVFQFNF